MIGHWSRLLHSGTAPAIRGFGEAFHAVALYGRDRQDLPADVDLDELASLLQAGTMDALVRWAATTQSSAALRSSLSRRADIVLRGAAASYGG